MQVLYSFPHRIGAGRICDTAWNQVAGTAAAGIRVRLFSGSVARGFDQPVDVRTTLSFRRARLPVRVLGRSRATRWHDGHVAAWLAANPREVDLVHLWPLGAIRTLRVARRLGIPTVLERPNAHTAFAYQAVAEENRRVGVALPRDHDHAFNPESLAREEEEYELASFLLCPSDFVAGTFMERGFPEHKLLRHRYGFDALRFRPDPAIAERPFSLLYAGVCEPRKGLHHALAAWLRSGAAETGRFRICGRFVDGYAEKLGEMLDHPSVEVLGHRSDLDEIMRSSHAFILPSVEEGSALVTYEARGSGCVLLVSSASGAVCDHGIDGLVHSVGDVSTLASQIRRLATEPDAYRSLRRASLAGRDALTWTEAGRNLADLYHRAAGSRRLLHAG